MQKEELNNEIRKFALKNALDYGKANTGAVLSKILAIDPALKSNIKKISELVRKTVEEINKMNKSEIESEFSAYSQEFKVREKEKEERTAKPKMELEGAVIGDFASRVPPEPGGYIHIGNAKQAILSAEFAKIYKGKVFLYFDDTNPENCKQEYVDAIKEDYEWLGLKFDREYYASDYIEKLYELIRKLISKNKAYVCNCDLEKMKKLRFEGKACEHRKKSVSQNISEFEEMLSGKVENCNAILRYMGDMGSVNTTMRDPVLARVRNITHYRLGNKYKVWPTYDMTTPIIDSLQGITDAIRDANWNELRGELDRAILKDLDLRIYRIHLEGRFNIKGMLTSKREIRELVKEKIVDGWDDPRLVTIRALRRRGIQPVAIRDFVLRFGMSITSAVVVDIDMLLAENRKLIDPIAKHMFFVKDPVKVIVRGAPKISAKLRLHPSKDFGFREYTTAGTFYISGDDAAALKEGEVVALKDLLTVKILSKNKMQVTTEATSSEKRDKIIQWVSDGNYTGCSVLVPEALIDEEGNVRKDSLKVEKGYVENYATKLMEHEIVQFERFGYCVLDNKKNMQFILTSK
jgi:glutamyl-tRNA synthetase